MKRVFTRMLTALLFVSMFVSPVLAVSVVDPGKTEILPDAATVRKAMDEFKGLSRKEKREKFRLVKKNVREFKAAKAKGAEASTNTLLLVILAILLPPLAVYLHEGTTNNRFWISLLLTLLLWLPGVIYALIVVLE
jgi:uncharacterized membrane protein YqaE (UPF0057 family)